MEPFVPQGDGDFWNLPERYLNAIVDEENKITRRKTLSIIYEEINKLYSERKSRDYRGDNGEGDSFDVKHNIAMLKLIRPLTRCIFDPVERCRETAYDILSLLVSMMSIEEQEQSMPLIMPLLVERFGEQEITESSEEVRFTAVKFMTTLCETVGATQLVNYVDDLILIMSHLIVDPFHSVRTASCKMTSYLAMKTKQVFHYNSERLIAPLCSSVTHQQFRVRFAVLECLGDVILYGNHKCINDVLPHVTQRLFDSTPQVRKIAITVAANWALDFVDRYSYFHKLLPIILTGLSDESPDNAELAGDLWKQVGEKYLKENLDEYKDELDFPKEEQVVNSDEGPYNRGVERPTFGCRILVWRNLCNILPGVVNDITDWVLSTRIKCAQILYQLVLHGEEKITMHVQNILKCLFLAISYECPIVVDNVQKSAKLVGWFVPLETTLPILTTAITSGNPLGPLKVLRSLVQGAKSQELEDCADVIGQLLTDKEICHTFNVQRQQTIVDIAIILTNRAPTTVGNLNEAGRKYFRMGISLLAMAQNAHVAAESMELLEKVKEVSKLETVAQLVDVHCADLLNEIKDNSSEWTALTPDKLIFEKILSFGGVIVDHHMEAVLKVMVDNLGPKRDPEVRLRFFAMLAENLQYCQKTVERESQLHTFVRHIIEDILTPNLVWVAGKTAGALRTAASSCILAILNADLLPQNILNTIAPILVPSLLGLLDDNALLSRRISCQSLGKLVSGCQRGLSPDIIHQIYPALLKRLDDVNNDVRLSACFAIATTFKNIPASYDVNFYRLHILNAVSTMIIHLDDTDKNIQEAVFDVLKILGNMQPQATIEECKKFRLRHRTPEWCDKLEDVLT